MSSEQKILLGPPSAHASVTFTRAPEPSKAEARSERSDSHESQPSQPSRPSPSRLLAVLSHSSSPRGPSGARSSVSSTYPGGAQSPVFAYHTHIQQKAPAPILSCRSFTPAECTAQVPPAEVAWQRPIALAVCGCRHLRDSSQLRGSSLELQLPPPPRSSPAGAPLWPLRPQPRAKPRQARDSELRPADLKLTAASLKRVSLNTQFQMDLLLRALRTLQVLTSDSRLETLPGSRL